MLNLIKKDFLLQKKSIYFAIGYAIFIFIAFQDPVFANFKYIMSSTAISYIIIMTAAAHEEKNNSDIILNSLPVSRKTIIRSRYLMFLASIVLTLLLTGIIGFLFSLAGLPENQPLISFADISSVLISVSLLSGIYYPLFVKFGSRYMRIFNSFLFLAIFFTPSFLASYIMENKSQQWVREIVEKATAVPETGYYVFALILSACILSISYLITLRLYENKDF